MRLSILLAAAAAAERVDRDADGVPDAAPERVLRVLLRVQPCVEIKILRRVRAESSRRPHAIDATPARWRGCRSSPLDGASHLRPHPTHWLISTQVQPRYQYLRPRRGDDPRGY